MTLYSLSSELVTLIPCLSDDISFAKRKGLIVDMSVIKQFELMLTLMTKLILQSTYQDQTLHDI